MTHIFLDIKTDPFTDTRYRKCAKCGEVKFEDIESDYFNMECRVVNDERQKLRERLESNG